MAVKKRDNLVLKVVRFYPETLEQLITLQNKILPGHRLNFSEVVRIVVERGIVATNDQRT